MIYKGDVANWNEWLGLKEQGYDSVSGDFYCNNNNITSLEGAPSEVGGDFDCSNNKIKSLEGAPSKVGGYFDCWNNKLKSLTGAPSEVGGDCWDNDLTDEWLTYAALAGYNT